MSALLKIQNEQDYDLAVDRLNGLIDEVGTDEHHPLCSLLETLGTLVHAWEEQHHLYSLLDTLGTPGTTPSHAQVWGKGIAAIPHGGASFAQSDLPDVGSQGVVSEILAGKRELNVRQIRALSERFGVSPSVFVKDNDGSHCPNKDQQVA